MKCSVSGFQQNQSMFFCHLKKTFTLFSKLIPLTCLKLCSKKRFYYKCFLQHMFIYNLAILAAGGEIVFCPSEPQGEVSCRNDLRKPLKQKALY